MKFFAVIRKILTLKCREASEMLSAAQGGDLSWSDRVALRLHLYICGPCRAYRRCLNVLRSVMRSARERLDAGQDLPGLELSDDARRNLRRLVK